MELSQLDALQQVVMCGILRGYLVCVTNHDDYI